MTLNPYESPQIPDEQPAPPESDTTTAVIISLVGVLTLSALFFLLWLADRVVG